MNADDALKRLMKGNGHYLGSETCPGDVSPGARARTAAEGQRPYAVIVACSDSRVIPEAIFSAGIGELFVIRVAGNVVGEHELGSIEYAAEHLGTRLVVVLGHTLCGAVGAALHGHADGAVASIVNDIAEAIGDERDEKAACRLNALTGAERIRAGLPELIREGLMVVPAVYDTASGKVGIIEE